MLIVRDVIEQVRYSGDHNMLSLTSDSHHHHSYVYPTDRCLTDVHSQTTVHGSLTEHLL